MRRGAANTSPDARSSYPDGRGMVAANMVAAKGGT
jgi:hypothetical protein